MPLDITTLTLLVILAVLFLTLALAVAGLNYKAREARLPEATRFVDVAHRLRTTEEQLGRRQDELREVERKISERDRYAAEVAHLEERMAALRAELGSLAPAREEIEQVKREAAEAAGALAGRKQELADLEREMDRLRSELDPDRIERLRRERAEVEAELTRVQGELAPLRAEHEVALGRIAEAGAMQARVEALKIETTRLEEQREELLDEAAETREAVARAGNERDAALRERDAAAAERGGAIAERDRAADERLRLEAMVAALEARVAALRGELGEGGAALGEPTPQDRAHILADLTVTPAALVTPALPRGTIRPEAEALHQVSTYLDRFGLRFSRRTLHAFHTALKINDAAQLTVLAGVSGTGKSILPRRYAEALGIHFLQVAVEPRWDSPQDLLGFYNYVEKKYRATELARLLAHLDPWRKGLELPEGTPDRRNHMALVLLDEMNLARVEYYFSEFLSRLEARPRWEPDLDRDNCKDALIPVDIRGLKDTPSLFPAHNILFVGTMNDDESTQSLSDKVLDRGNVLQFPAPDDFRPPAPQQDPAGAPDAQSFTEWRNWVRSANALDGPAANQTQETIRALARLMQGFGRPFGHRLNQAIRAYVANYPSEGNAGLNPTVPLADQVELRILPRLRGVQIEGDHHARFDELAALVETRLGDSQLAQRLRETVEEQMNGAGLFVWRGLARP